MTLQTSDFGDSSDGPASTDSDENDQDGSFNANWADAVSKILNSNKPKGKKCLVLSRAKKLTAVKKTAPRPAGFQVETTDGSVKEGLVEEDAKEVPPVKRKKRELPSLRTKPDILQKDRERTLQKIATRGVVQLFNAVKTQQQDISKKLKEAGPLEVRKEKVLKNIDKRAFLDVLMGEKSQHVENVEAQTQESGWSVLKDDFMMGAKLKDWDKELEENQEMESEIE